MQVFFSSCFVSKETSVSRTISTPLVVPIFSRFVLLIAFSRNFNEFYRWTSLNPPSLNFSTVETTFELYRISTSKHNWSKVVDVTQHLLRFGYDGKPHVRYLKPLIPTLTTTQIPPYENQKLWKSNLTQSAKHLLPPFIIYLLHKATISNEKQDLS